MTDSITEKYNKMVEDLEDGIDYGEKVLGPLFNTLESRKKQLDICYKFLNDSNAKLEMEMLKSGRESVATFKQAQLTEGYIKSLTTSMKSYQEVFVEAHSLANIVGALRERLALYKANRSTPELVVEAAPETMSVDSLLGSSKKNFGGN